MPRLVKQLPGIISILLFSMFELRFGYISGELLTLQHLKAWGVASIILINLSGIIYFIMMREGLIMNRILHTLVGPPEPLITTPYKWIVSIYAAYLFTFGVGLWWALVAPSGWCISMALGGVLAWKMCNNHLTAVR